MELLGDGVAGARGEPVDVGPTLRIVVKRTLGQSGVDLSPCRVRCKSSAENRRSVEHRRFDEQPSFGGCRKFSHDVGAGRGRIGNDLPIGLGNGFLEVLGGQCLPTIGGKIIKGLVHQAIGVGIQDVLGDLIVDLPEAAEDDLLETCLHLVASRV